jgi:hypothetical protein
MKILSTKIQIFYPVSIVIYDFSAVFEKANLFYLNPLGLTLAFPCSASINV